MPAGQNNLFSTCRLARSSGAVCERHQSVRCYIPLRKSAVIELHQSNLLVLSVLYENIGTAAEKRFRTSQVARWLAGVRDRSVPQLKKYTSIHTTLRGRRWASGDEADSCCTHFVRLRWNWDSGLTLWQPGQAFRSVSGPNSPPSPGMAAGR